MDLSSSTNYDKTQDTALGALSSNKVTKGGDADGASLVIGTNDQQLVIIEQNGTPAFTIDGFRVMSQNLGAPDYKQLNMFRRTHMPDLDTVRDNIVYFNYLANTVPTVLTKNIQGEILNSGIASSHLSDFSDFSLSTAVPNTVRVVNNSSYAFPVEVNINMVWVKGKRASFSVQRIGLGDIFYQMPYLDFDGSDYQQVNCKFYMSFPASSSLGFFITNTQNNDDFTISQMTFYMRVLTIQSLAS